MTENDFHKLVQTKESEFVIPHDSLRGRAHQDSFSYMKKEQLQKQDDYQNLSKLSSGRTGSCHSSTSSSIAASPLRQRTSSDTSWFSLSDEEDSDDEEVDLLPAIRKTIRNACEESESLSSVTSGSWTSQPSQQNSVRISFGSDIARPRKGHVVNIYDDYDDDELSILQDSKYYNINDTDDNFNDTDDKFYGNDASSSSQQSVVTFSVVPPQVYTYECPTKDMHKQLYYCPDEMEEMLQDYLKEQERTTQQEQTVEN